MEEVTWTLILTVALLMGYLGYLKLLEWDCEYTHDVYSCQWALEPVLNDATRG